MMRPLPLAVVAALAPGAASACEIATYAPGHVVPAPTFAADCSFIIPGPVTLYTDIEGAVPVNIGGGRIGQRITRGFGCGHDEEIWIVDCHSGAEIGIAGPQADDMNQSRRADLLYPPHGALRLTAGVTVPDIAAVAAREGYDHWPDILAHLRAAYSVANPALARMNGPDPACGCRIFYPDSPQANQ